MSSLDSLLDRLRDADIRLTLDGDRLGVNAPKGALTAELRAELGALKEEIRRWSAACARWPTDTRAFAPSSSPSTGCRVASCVRGSTYRSSAPI